MRHPNATPKLQPNNQYGESPTWRWAVGWSVGVLALSCLPYLFATLTAPEGWQFVGFLVNPLDGNSYLAKMEQGRAGNWLFHLTYSPEPHRGAFIFTFYLALGHVSKLTGLSNIIIFHLARLLAGLGLLLVAFQFIRRITPAPAERRLAFLFVLTASGLGWLGAAFGAFPIDLWVPEAFVPYSLYANPHFPLAMMLMLIIFGQIITVSSLETELAQHAYALLATSYSPLWTGLAALALAMVLPFALLTILAALALYFGLCFAMHRRLPWQQIWPTLSAGAFGAPVIFYQYWISITHPMLAGWSAQNITPAPKILDFGLGYGLVGLLAVVGGAYVVKQGKPATRREWPVLLWAIATVGLVYVPFELQRRMITGLHLPLCILAAMGLTRWLAGSRLNPGYRQLVRMAAVTLGALGTLLVWTLPLAGTMQPPTESATAALFFMRHNEKATFEWLQQHTGPDDVILASPRVGLFVPGQTGARAFYGHPFETIAAKTKEAQANAFYSGRLEAVPEPVDYIIYGPSEQALGRPPQLAELQAVFTAGDVQVYKVE